MASPAGASRPLCPSSTTSGMPPTRVATLSAASGDAGSPSTGLVDDDPIAAYQQMADVFDHPLAAIAPAVGDGGGLPRSGGADATAPVRVSSAEALADRRYGRVVAESRSSKVGSMSDAEYGVGPDVVLPDGSFVPDPDSPTGHMRAPIQD